MPNTRQSIAASGGLAFGAGLTLGLAVAHAAPLPGAATALHTPPAQLSRDAVSYRRCWTHNGRRHCGSDRAARADGARSDRYSDYYGGYYEHNPEKLPYGSPRWWEEMVRENRGGNGSGGGRN